VRGRVEAGDAVQTPLGKGVVREVRNGGRLLVDVAGRAVEIKAADVSLVAARPAARTAGAPRTERGSSRGRASRSVPSEIDLHGLTVEQALTRAEDALNDAMLADVSPVRFIHGRSGGRIRAALHAKLRAIPSVRRFLVDPRNEGVTIVEL
jgi:DNA mismatch repair protein MutS2